MTIKELLEKRAEAIAQARAIQDKAEKEEKRDMTAEEAANVDKYIEDAADLRKQIADAETSAARTKRLEEAERELEGDTAKRRTRTEPDPVKASGGEPEKGDPEREMRALRTWILRNPDLMETDERHLVRDVFSELRALQADLDVSGGYLVAPPQFVAQLIEDVKDQVLLRTLGETVPLNTSDAITYPSLDTRPAAPVWTAEVGTITLDSSMAFGKRTFTPHKLAKGIVVSEKLLQVSAMPVENIVRGEMAYQFAITEEGVGMTGSGAGEWLGLFTASAQGISTARDVSTGNTSSSIQFDNLLTVRGTLKSQYRARAAWLFHRDGVTQITKLKDGEGRYIWQPSTQAGRPDLLLGHPVHESEFAPNTFTTGLYVGIFGDFRKYRIIDFQGAQIVWKRHTEALAGQDLSGKDNIGFTARKWSDGGPVSEEAFVRVKLG